jgi:hypothetical protein
MSKRILGVGAALGLLAIVGSQAPPSAEGQPAAVKPALHLSFGDSHAKWSVVAGDFEYSAATPAGLKAITPKKVPLVLETKPGGNRQAGAAPAPRRLTALVRLRPDEANPHAAADFSVARTDDKAPGFRMAVSTSRGVDYVAASVWHDTKPLHDLEALAKKMDWSPPYSNAFTYYPRAYGIQDIRPGWPVDFRVRIEHDMARLASVHEKWYAVRVEVKPGEVRFWLDDRLVGIKRGEGISSDGSVRIQLSPGAELARADVTTWVDPPRYEPVSIDGYANELSFLGSQVKPGTFQTDAPALLTPQQIPFALPAANAEGKDHIDIGKSLFRHANQEGYFPTFVFTWLGSGRRDPARIQLRVANGEYDALYLLAAADGAPETVPLITAMFYRPQAGFAENFETQVPLATAEADVTRAISVTLANGKKASLWLVRIPLDPGRLSAFSDLDIIEIELTKKVQQFRSYPDPILYGWHQGGPASGVHVFGVTLGKAPLGFTFEPDRFGHVWTAPEVPAYTATIIDRADTAHEGVLTVVTRSHDGSETLREAKPVALKKGASQALKFSLPVKLNGYHDIEATLDIGGKKWVEKRSFVRLAPDTRAERWTEGKGALFGYWSYHGGHYAPKASHHVELMTKAGARAGLGLPDKENPLIKKHWARVPCGAWEVSPQPWAREEKYDPKLYAAYQKATIDLYTKAREAIPAEFRPDHVAFFPEPHVSQRLTEGNVPSYWNAPDHVLTPDEQANLRMFMVTAKCAAEAVRAKWPDVKILIPWGDPLFAVPLLRAGFPKNLIDGSGLDNPGFERLPEMQLHQICVHRLYELKKEYARAGIPEPRLQYMEGIFVPTEVGAVSYREQMDLYNRWTLISMAYGVTRFYSGWFAFDCGNYYGAEHYGGCGIQRRIPYCDPKPAYAAYATMTQMLDQANFDGWVKTGSHTNFCLRFKGPKGNVYSLWNIRGKRPVTLTLATDGDVAVTDVMNNTRLFKSKDKQVTITTDSSVTYVSGVEIVSAAVGDPDHSDAKPSATAKQVADLADGSWAYTNQRDKVYENGTFAMQRFPGKFAAAVEDDPKHGKVLDSILRKQSTVHELMPWYNILAPKKPVVLDGAPSHLGLWVKGASDWGRVIYVLKDAKGEKWTSIGTQDQYNCDDVHSWSAFNFDGWRYVRFELPGHAGWDSFRKHGTTWWRADGGDGVVDLPLTLENIIVEQRSHVLYVNDVQPTPSDTVAFGKLYVEYASPEDATPEAVRLSKLRMPLPAGAPELPNPIADMQKTGVGLPAAIGKLVPPIERNDGTAVHVHFSEMPKAKQYFCWVSAHPDGRGAVNLTPGGLKSGALVGGLRPALPFYFWVTYSDEQNKMSKPSPAAMATLKDTFTEK